MHEQIAAQGRRASRQYVGTSAGIHPDDVPYLTDEGLSIRPRGTSARRYQPQPYQRSTTQDQPIQRASLLPVPISAQPSRELAKQKHWLLALSFVLVLMFLGWLLFSLLGNWWHTSQDDLHYGRPRTFQCDANVGHNGTSHFTVENLHGHILIMEVSVDNPSASKIYLGPTLTGPGAEDQPATLTFQDTHHDGYPDMLLTVDNTVYVFVNSKDGGFHMQQGG